MNACASPGSAARTTAEVAAAAGVPATYEGLVPTAPATLVDASDRVAERYRRDPDSGPRHYDPSIYGPVAGVAGLPTGPLTACAEGAARGVELLVCHTAEEYWLLDAVGSCARVTTEQRLARFASDHGLPGPLLEAYRALMPDASVNDLYLAVYGDLLFGEYSSRLAESHARAGAAPTSPASSGSATAGEAGQGLALCGHPVRLRHRGGRERPLPHRRTSCRRRPRTGGADDRAWADFATTGDPGWPPVTSGAVRIWDVAPEDDRGRWDAFRTPWRDAGLPLLAP